MEKEMDYTEAQAWLDAHELIECKPLKGRWTVKTCLGVSTRLRKSSKNSKNHDEANASSNMPCQECPVYAQIKSMISDLDRDPDSGVR
jgi:hypothetical protein